MKYLLLSTIIAGLAAGCGDDGAALPVEMLRDPNTCAECHPQHFVQWSGSMHAYAAEDPVFVAMNKRGQRETGNALGDFCIRCHAPMAVALGLTDGTDYDPANLPAEAKGITCYFCHNVDSIGELHNNGLVLANDQTMRGGLENPVTSPAHHSKYDAKMDGNANESEMCGSCHDIVVPAAINGVKDVSVERTFAEWQTTFFATDHTAGIHLTCSQCHMISKDDVVADAPDLSVPLRKNGFHEHLWPAVDQAMTPFPETEAQAAAIQRDLDPAVAIIGAIPTGQIKPRGGICVTPNAGGEITVRIDGLGIGHRFPTGSAQDRRAWIELIAFDVNNNILFSSGLVGDDQDPEDLNEPGLNKFWDVATKQDGTPAHMFWEIVNHDESQTLKLPSTRDPNDPASDHSSTIHYSIPGLQNQVDHITARFRIRPFSLAVIKDLIDSGDLDPSFLDKVPTLEVQATQRTWTKAAAAGQADGCTPKPM